MSKRKAAFFLSLVMAVSMLTACNSPSNTTPSNAAESSATETVESSALTWENSPETTSSQPSADTSSKPESSATTSSTAESSKKTSEPSKTESSKEQSSHSSTTTPSQQPSETTQPVPEKPSPAASSVPSSEPSKGSKTSQSTPVSSAPSRTSSVPSSSVPSSSPETEVPDTPIGDLQLYQQLFSLDNKVTIDVTISQEEINKLQADFKKYDAIHSKSPIYRMCTVTIRCGSSSYTIDEVGIRLKGNTSLDPFYDLDTGKLNLSHYKLSFNETFDDEAYYGSSAKVWSSKTLRKARKNRRFATLKKLDVKWNRNYDDTHIREIYATRLFAESDVLVQKINLCQLSINDNNYGIVSIYEPVDELFLEKRLPAEACGGNLYKCAWTMSGCTYQTNNSVGVADKDKGTKYNFDLKTNEKTADHSVLRNFLKVINKSSASKNDIEAVLDTKYFAKFMAASYFAGDPDDIRNNYNNHYIYFRKDNGKAIFIPYDNDRTLGVTYGYNPEGTGMTAVSPYSTKACGAGNSQQNPLISKMLTTNSLATFQYVKDQYTAQLKHLASSGILNETNFEKDYNRAKKNYESAVKPSVSFANAKKSFQFSLEGTKNSGKKANMSFAQYVEGIMATYRKYVS